MKKYPAGEFKTHCLRVMEEVRRRRETVVITKKGTPIAKLVPVDEPPEDVFGCLEQEITIAGDILSPVVAADSWEALK
jgi:prevent-host-death family protein